MARKYPQKDVKLLWDRSAGRCAFPGCQTLCTAAASHIDPNVVLGVIAHIVAHGNDGPRADPLFPNDEKDKYENWILLCPNHHSLVDGQPNTYTVSDLQSWRIDHENWVNNRLEKEIPSVGFAEIEMITQSLINTPIISDRTISFELTNPKDKLTKNNLSNKTYSKITMGLIKAKEVQQFVEQASTLDPIFPTRLKATFLQEYKRLKDEESLSGDGLFEAIHQFASPSTKAFEYQAAGLAVVTYLFEKCDIFER